MAEGLISLNTDTKLLSVEDYEKAYDSGYLTYEKYLNTGILSIVKSDIFQGSNWCLANIKKLELPNVLTINGPIFSIYTPYNLEEIIAPKLKTINRDNFILSLPNFRSIYLRDIEYINWSITNYNSHIFDNMVYLSYSKLVSIEGPVFPLNNMSKLERIYLPNLETISDSYDNYFYSNSKVSYINLPKLKNVSRIGFWDLTNLQYLLLSSIEFFPSLNNLPLLKSIEFNGIISNSSVAYSNSDTFLRGGDFSNISNISLPNIETLYACGLGFSRLTSNNITLTVPKLKRLTFFANFGNIKSITLPALTKFSNYNMLYQSNKNRALQFEIINMPNVSIVYGNSLINNDYTYYHLQNNVTLNLNNCEVIYNSAFNPTGDDFLWTRQYSYGFIIKSPKLKTIGSSAFKFCYNLNEIDLAHVSVLNEDVFCNAGGHYSSQTYSQVTYFGLTLKNSYNIKEVKRGAFAATYLNTYYLSLPNCESFDFNQAQYYAENYSEFVTKFGYALYPLYVLSGSRGYAYINEFNLPKLPNIIFDYTSMPVSFYQGRPYFLMKLFCSKRFKVDACSEIKIIDGDHGSPLAGYYDYYETYSSSTYSVTTYKSSDIKLFSTELLYIPNCETFEHIRNESLYENFPSTYDPYIRINCHKLYAPKLSNLSNFILEDCWSLETADNLNILNTINKLVYCTHTESAYSIPCISFSYSFSTPIELKYGDESRYTTITSIISLPNYYGEIYTTGTTPIIYNGSIYIGYASRINMYIGGSTNITLLNSVYDDRFINLIHYSSDSIELYLPECVSLGLRNRNITTITSEISSLTIGNFGGFYSNDKLIFPKIENVIFNISNIKFGSTVSKHQPILNLTFRLSGWSSVFNMPSLTNFSFTVQEIMNEYYDDIKLSTTYLSDNITSITLGISNFYDVRFYSTNLTYLSLSNLTYIPKGGTNTYRRSINYHTIYTYHTGFQFINLDSVSYIEEFGLALPQYSNSINFPELTNLLPYAVRLPLVTEISFPKLEYLGGDNLWECSLMTTLELPSTCSSIGHNAIPENFSILKLNYSGVVSMPDISVEYTEWDFWASRYIYHLCYPFSDVARIVQVPMSLLSDYNADSIWGSYLKSYNWFIVGF